MDDQRRPKRLQQADQGRSIVDVQPLIAIAMTIEGGDEVPRNRCGDRPVADMSLMRKSAVCSRRAARRDDETLWPRAQPMSREVPSEESLASGDEQAELVHATASHAFPNVML